jgi:membrane dipeptidase
LWEGKGLEGIGRLGQYVGDDTIRDNVGHMIAGGCKSASVNLTSDVSLLALGEPGNKVRDYLPGEAWEDYLRQRKILQEFFATMPLERAASADDIERIHAAGKLAVFLSVEGGHMVEDDLGLMETLRDDGIVKFQPIHYVFSTLGDNQTDEEVHGGLTPLGKEAVKLAHGLGMVLDAAHASLKAAADMAEASGAPIVLSHTLMKYPGASKDGEFPPRWISQEYAKLIAETGGMIGTWAINAPNGVESADEFVDAVMAPWFRDFRDFPALCAKLLDGGFSEADLVKFIGGNALRIMEAVSPSP